MLMKMKMKNLTKYCAISESSEIPLRPPRSPFITRLTVINDTSLAFNAIAMLDRDKCTMKCPHRCRYVCGLSLDLFIFVWFSLFLFNIVPYLHCTIAF